MKKGPYTEKELKYIKKNFSSKSPDAIAKKLERSVTTVKKYVQQYLDEEKQEMVEAIHEEEQAEKNDFAFQLMGRNGNGAVTMTEAASMHADEALKRNKKMPSSRYKNCIKVFDKDKDIR